MKHGDPMPGGEPPEEDPWLGLVNADMGVFLALEEAGLEED